MTLKINFKFVMDVLKSFFFTLSQKAKVLFTDPRLCIIFYIGPPLFSPLELILYLSEGSMRKSSLLSAEKTYFLKFNLSEGSMRTGMFWH